LSLKTPYLTSNPVFNLLLPLLPLLLTPCNLLKPLYLPHTPHNPLQNLLNMPHNPLFNPLFNPVLNIRPHSRPQLPDNPQFHHPHNQIIWKPVLTLLQSQGKFASKINILTAPL
jgi:hypothetical protein